MAETGSIQKRLRDAADKAALDTLVRYTTLRGDDARKVARRVVTAVAPDLRAQYADQLVGATQQELLVSGLFVLAAAGTNLAALTAMFVAGNRKTRVLAASAAVLHASLVTYAQIKKRRMAAAARNEPSVRSLREQATV